MVEYLISRIVKGFQYDPYFKIIFIGYYPECFNKLSDDEQIKLTADNLIHEYTHHIIENKLDIKENDAEKISIFFDAICHLFRDEMLHYKYYELVNKSTNGCKLTLWKDVIKNEGFISLLNYYHIDKRTHGLILKKYNKGFEK